MTSQFFPRAGVLCAGAAAALLLVVVAETVVHPVGRRTVLEYEIPYDQTYKHMDTTGGGGGWAYESYSGPSDGSYTFMGIRSSVDGYNMNQSPNTGPGGAQDHQDPEPYTAGVGYPWGQTHRVISGAGDPSYRQPTQAPSVIPVGGHYGSSNVLDRTDPTTSGMFNGGYGAR